MPPRLPRPTRTEFERLVREHHAAVWAAASRAVRDRALVEDAVQDVFLAVLEGRFVPEPGPIEERSLRWYAAKRALELGRGEGRRRVREEQHAMQQDTHSHTPIEDDERASLLRHVEALPDELRTALRLRFEEEMTWDAVGAALAIAPSSAHDRVQRALERLRSALRVAGLPALAIGVEAQLPHLAPPPPPSALANGLLGLASPAAAPLTAGWLAGGGLAVAATVIGLALWLGGDAKPGGAEEFALADGARRVALEPAQAVNAPNAEEARVALGATQESALPSRDFASNQMDWSEDFADPSDARTAIVGRVVDPRGDPLEGLKVYAARAGQKGNPFGTDPASFSRADGSFRIELERVDHSLVLIAGSDEIGRARASSEAFRLEPGEQTRRPDLVVDFPGARDPRASWSLDVSVSDEDGRSVAGARVLVEDSSRDPWQRTEAHAATDAAGRATLAGERVGARTLVVEAASQGFAPSRTAREVAPGTQAARVVLVRGLEIAGRVSGLAGETLDDDGARLRGMSSLNVLVDLPDGSGGPSADVEPDGSFRVHGLLPGRYGLRIHARGRSPATLRVAAGTSGLAIELKPIEDERDVGLHDGEIHGRLVDASDRAPALANVDAVEVEPLWELEGGELPSAAEFERDLLPWVIYGRPVQRMLENDPPPPSDRFHAVGLDREPFALVARVPGYAATVAGPFALAERELRTGAEIALARPLEVGGTVRNVDGAPLAGAYVVLAGDGPISRRKLAECDAEVAKNGVTWLGLATDAEGRFRFGSLPPGMRVRIAVLHALHAPRTSDWIEAGRTDVELHVGPAR